MLLASSQAVGEGIEHLFSVQALFALLTLTLLEIVLGVDNIIMISVMSKKLPAPQSDRARLLGLGLAMGVRVLLLLAISWLVGLTAPLFGVPAFWTGVEGDRFDVTGRDLILAAGGAFLMYKAVGEIHEKLEGRGGDATGRPAVSFAGVIVTILALDVIFSLDSVITAVGMVQTHPGNRWVGLSIMIAAVMISVGIMLFASKPIADFVESHPTVKMLALSFLLIIGLTLVADGLHFHVPKGYLYFAIAFSLGVECLNLRLRKGGRAHLREESVIDPGLRSTSDTGV